MQQLIGRRAVVMMERTGVGSGWQPRLAILAQRGTAKHPWLFYLPSEVVRLRNRAGHVYIAYIPHYGRLGGSTPGEFHQVWSWVCAVSGLGRGSGPRPRREGLRASNLPSETGRTTA